MSKTTNAIYVHKDLSEEKDNIAFQVTLMIYERILLTLIV